MILTSQDSSETRVSYTSKIVMSCGAFIALIVLAGMVSYISAKQSEYHLERSQLAHEALESYLRVSSNTFRLFKVYTNEIVIPELDYEAVEVQLRDDIDDDLEALRLIIAEEVRLAESRENEGEELVRLGQIERKVDTIVAEFERITAQYRAGQADQPSSSEASEL